MPRPRARVARCAPRRPAPRRPRPARPRPQARPRAWRRAARRRSRRCHGCGSTRRACADRSRSAAGASTTWSCPTTGSRPTPKARPSCCFRPPAAPQHLFRGGGLDAGAGIGRRRARPRHLVASRRPRPAPGHASHPHLGQRGRAALQPHLRDRPRLHVPHHPAGGEHGRLDGDAFPLRPHLALGHAHDLRLLHPARGADRRLPGRAGGGGLRGCRGRGVIHLRGHRRLDRHHRQVLAGGADSKTPIYPCGASSSIRATARRTNTRRISPGRTPLSSPPGRSPRPPAGSSPAPRRSSCSTTMPSSTTLRASTGRWASAGSIS